MAGGVGGDARAHGATHGAGVDPRCPLRPFQRTVTVHKDSTGHVGVVVKKGKIVSLAKDSSAARNGLLTHHYICEVNGQNVIGMKVGTPKCGCWQRGAALRPFIGSFRVQTTGFKDSEPPGWCHPRGRCGVGRLGCCTPAFLSLLVFSFCTTSCAKHTCPAPRMWPGQALRAAVPGRGPRGPPLASHHPLSPRISSSRRCWRTRGTSSR